MDKRKYIEEIRLLGEEVQKLEETNCPTNPSKWSYYKSQAKQKFDVYPSAYANGWASKQYKAAGGGWKQCAGESVTEDHSDNPNDKYVVRPCNNPNEPWAVWEGEVRVKGFATREEAQAYADAQNKAQGLGESVTKGRINELSADTYKNTVKAALQRGDSKGNALAVKALQAFGKEVAKELAGKSFEVKGSKDNLAKGFYRGNSQKFINQFKMTFTGEGQFIESRNVKVFGSDEAHFHMKVEFQVPDNIGGWSTDVQFRGYEKYKFPGTIQFSIKQGRVWVWYNSADTDLEFTRVGAREMAKLADTIVAAMDFPTKAKHNTIKQFDPMKASNESVNEAYIVTYAKKKGEKPVSAAFQLKGSALSFERDLKKDGYITMITQKKVKGIDEGKKRFRQQNGIGKSKYTISYHDGVKKHKDGSDFFDIQIFKNQKDVDTFRKALLQKGFVEESVTESKSLKEFDADTYRKKQDFVIGRKFAQVASDSDVELMARLKRANSEHAWQLKQNIASMDHLYKKYKIQSSKGVEK